MASEFNNVESSVFEVAIGTALIAAGCRVHLDAGDSVWDWQLSALASIDCDHLDVLAREGHLRMVSRKIEADEAKRWLGTRGIEPYASLSSRDG